eukprot:4961590-Prymnesium_polylepis.1
MSRELRPTRQEASLQASLKRATEISCVVKDGVNLDFTLTSITVACSREAPLELAFVERRVTAGLTRAWEFGVANSTDTVRQSHEVDLMALKAGNFAGAC